MSSLLPPKKRQQQQQAQKHDNKVPAEASKKPEPSEEAYKATANNSGQTEASSIADVESTSIAVETSKIRGTAPPRKPRVGDEYQAELPQLVEQPPKR